MCSKKPKTTPNKQTKSLDLVIYNVLLSLFFPNVKSPYGLSRTVLLGI